MSQSLTPAQQQYMNFKRQHKDAILFFRLGDFYELFYEDAKIAHKELDITLTARNKKSADPIPMAGVPHHSLERYVQKLVASGYKVAIADQIGEVIPWKVVAREVTRIVTPGTHISDETLYSYIAAVTYTGGEKEIYHLARGDVSLGNYFSQSFPNLAGVIKTLARLQPKEVVIDINFPQRDELEQYIHQVLQVTISIDDCPHDLDHYLQSVLGTSSLIWYGEALTSGRKQAVGVLFSYVEKMQKHKLSTIHTLTHMTPVGKVHLDHITIKNLEIFESSYEWSAHHSLYGVINTMKTAMWSRLLYEFLAHPSNDEAELVKRLDNIDYFTRESDRAKECLRLLTLMPDLPKLWTKIILQTPSALRLQNLKNIFTWLFNADNSSFREEIVRMWWSQEMLATIDGLFQLLNQTIKDEIVSDEIDYIMEWYDSQVDELRKVAYHSDELLLAYHLRLVTATKLTNLKLKYITNQGYFIEVTPKDISTFESFIDHTDQEFDFVRRQTLKGGERYMSTYLEELQVRILSAKEQLQQREAAILQNIIQQLSQYTESFLQFCHIVAQIDLTASFAVFSLLHEWTRPQLDKWYDLTIEKWKHPVVEKYLPVSEQFIPNDIHLTSKHFFHLITGPNMWGKSTFLRQTALITLLAHAWLYVPATYAKIWLVDGIFARVWSGDVLAKNQSTFMTEMLEMANILHNATDRSLVILDELGRGTSTYDGLAIAKSIAVYLCQAVSCKTLFATHYHELIDLEGSLAWFANFSLWVYETEQEVVFLKKIVKGGASKSYGIDVAKLAGVPPPVIEQAKQFLADLEPLAKTSKRPQQAGLNFGAINDTYKKKYDQLYKLIDALDLHEITPIEALVKLKEIEDIIAP